MLVAAVNSWPDSIDLTITLVYLAVVFGVPAFGYVLLALDVRALTGDGVSADRRQRVSTRRSPRNVSLLRR